MGESAWYLSDHKELKEIGSGGHFNDLTVCVNGECTFANTWTKDVCGDALNNANYYK